MTVNKKCVVQTVQVSAEDEALVADGYELVKAELAAVPVEELVQVNVDVQSASRAILGSLKEMRDLRERFATSSRQL